MGRKSGRERVGGRVGGRRLGAAVAATVWLALGGVGYPPASASDDGGTRAPGGSAAAFPVALADLHTRYLQALHRLETRLTRERRLHEALAVRLEFNRFREGLAEPDPSLLGHDRLVELATIYVHERARLESRHGVGDPVVVPLAGGPEARRSADR